MLKVGSVLREKSIIDTVDPSHLLPAFINTDKMLVLIVGGGKESLEKINVFLLSSPATAIKVVDMVLIDEIKQIAQTYPNVTAIERALRANDLEEADIVVITLPEGEARTEIIDATSKYSKLVYVAGEPELSTFHFGAGMPQEILPPVFPPIDTLEQKLTANEEAKSSNRWKKVATYSLCVFACMLIGHLIFSSPPIVAFRHYTIQFYQGLDSNFHWMVLAGFLAQLVDGALGMGYGVTSSSILLSTGINPAAISGSIHAAEMFASGASGYSHYKFGNVNKKLFKVLLIPGVTGAVLGALLLVWLGSEMSDYLRPVLAAYTLLLGIRIIFNALKKDITPKKFKRYGWLAGLGGFLDSFGGGGWGPIVTTTLITKGRSPRFVIGSVSLTEFFVTLASAFTFFTLIGVSHWQVIAALIIGGLLGAPVAAKLAGKLPRRTSMILLGILVIFWSFRILVKIF